ncbi:MAG: dTMP kinase [Planctomycetia bacterium]|nr:dTMP kinase [Planctomycetia bacterium]
MPSVTQSVPKPLAGSFIALEGIDGAGKSSQIAAIVDWLRTKGLTVVTCRDPGSTAAGDAIRAILLERQDILLSPTAEMLLYMAARAQLVTEVIRPALNRGDWVVSDRFLLANIVYQGHAGGLDPETIRQVGAVATETITPDLVLLLDIDLGTAAARLSRPLDKLETRGNEFRQRLADGYRLEAAKNPERIRSVDARGSIDDVTASLLNVLADYFTDLLESSAMKS